MKLSMALHFNPNKSTTLWHSVLGFWHFDWLNTISIIMCSITSTQETTAGSLISYKRGHF
jgi:hypothetical protein